MSGQISITVEEGDVLETRADLLALKYAQRHLGVDGAVASRLSGLGVRPDTLEPKPGDYRLVQARGALASPKVLFIGVVPVQQLRYTHIRHFARLVLQAPALLGEEPRHVALTLHGADIGLDEEEAFSAELAGLTDAIVSGEQPKSLRAITVVESRPQRAARMAALLQSLFPSGFITDAAHGGVDQAPPERLRSVGSASETKPHIFVAMPFKEDMDDLYHYGIENAVHKAGYLCERADLASFVGDVMDWVRQRISSASVVIADLSGANPNVYLELGYAWGCQVPTVLIISSADELTFDVRGQRCLVYQRIRDVEKALEKELVQLRETGAI